MKSALDAIEMEKKQYELNLMDLINRMVDASKESNDFMFKFAYDEFQLFAKENWT